MDNELLNIDKISEQDDGEIEIDLVQLFNVFVSKIWIPIICVVMCAAALFVYFSFFVPKKYTSNTTLYAYNTMVSSSGATSSSDLTTSANLLKLYSVIFTSESILDDVKKDLGLTYSDTALAKMINVESVDSTAIYKLEVTSTSPQEAKDISDALIAHMPEKIQNITDGWELVVVDTAKVPTQKSYPSVAKFTVIGALVGLVIGCIIIFVIYITDNVVHSESFVEKELNLPVLTIIPDLNSKSKRYGYYKKA